MAKLTAKYIIDGSEVDIDEINLDQITVYEFISELIKGGFLSPEEELPERTCKPIHGYYGLLDKDGVKLNIQEEPDKTLSSLGICDGDSIRIIAVACCA